MKDDEDCDQQRSGGSNPNGHERNQGAEETGEIEVIDGDDDLSKLFATALKGVENASRCEDKP